MDCLNWLSKHCVFAQETIERDAAQASVILMESVFGPADWKTNVTDGCDLFDERADILDEAQVDRLTLLRSIKSMHETQFKVNLAEQEIQSAKANPNISDQVTEKKFFKLKQAISKWRSEFAAQSQQVIPFIKQRMTIWVNEHSKESHYSIYYEPMKRCIEKKKLGYFPFRSFPVSFGKLMVEEVRKRLSARLNIEQNLEDISYLYPRILPLIVKFMQKKGYQVYTGNEALVDILSVPKLVSEFSKSIDARLRKDIVNEILYTLPKQWYLLFPKLGFEMADEIKPMLNEMISTDIKARFPDFEKITDQARQALSNLDSAKTMDQLMGALSFILTLQHNSGPMADHFGLNKRHLDVLTNDMKRAESMWKAEVENLIPKNDVITYRDLLGRGGPEDIYENFSVYQKKTHNWFKIAR